MSVSRLLSAVLLSLGVASSKFLQKSRLQKSAAGPRQCRNGGGVHTWIEHGGTCEQYSLFTRDAGESRGCELPDFRWKKRMNDPKVAPWSNKNNEVHWNIGAGVLDMTKFHYSGENSNETGKVCSAAYSMPEYCSRAIVSELSTVYDGVQRIAFTMAGAKDLISSKEESCSSALTKFLVPISPDTAYEGILSSNVKRKACWGLGHDWRKLWCAKYARCSCSHEQGECTSNAKIQCCRDMYQLFLDGDKSVRESAHEILRNKQYVTSSETASTLFTIEIEHQTDFQPNWSKKWLRLARRPTPIASYPRIFMEISSHRTFVEAETFDLCNHQGFSNDDSPHGDVWAFIGPSTLYEGTELHRIRIPRGRRVGNGISEDVPESVNELHAHLQSLRSQC